MKKQDKIQRKSARARLGENAAQHMLAVLLKAQRKWACWMDSRFNQLSTVKRQVLFGLFCVALTGVSTMAIVTAFKVESVPSKAARSPFVPKSSLPIMLAPDQGSAEGDSLLAAEVRAIQNQLDSLDQTAQGREVKRRLFQEHPGLLDSLNEIKQLYNLK